MRPLDCGSHDTLSIVAEPHERTNTLAHICRAIRQEHGTSSVQLRCCEVMRTIFGSIKTTDHSAYIRQLFSQVDILEKLGGTLSGEDMLYAYIAHAPDKAGPAIKSAIALAATTTRPSSTTGAITLVAPPPDRNAAPQVRGGGKQRSGGPARPEKRDVRCLICAASGHRWMMCAKLSPELAARARDGLYALEHA
jgi:hypothetical protein